MHHPPSRPHRASRRLPPLPALETRHELPAKALPESSALAAALDVSPRLRRWLQSRGVSLALSTGERGKIITLGVAESGFRVFEANCDAPGALLQTAAGLYVAARERVWRFDDALGAGECYRGTDRLFLPSQCRPTGTIGIEDLAAAETGKLLVAVARFNCIARMNSRGDLKPIWRPAVANTTVTGLCLDNGALAYITQMSEGGGQVIDVASERPVADQLNRPRAPRLYRNKLWLLESGTGWFGWVDPAGRRFERRVQLPGTPRGLRFLGDHALIAAGPGVHWFNLNTGRIDHTLGFAASIAEIIDVALIPGETVPRLAGVSVAESAPAVTRQVAV